MPTTEYENALRQARSLSVEEQQRLLSEIGKQLNQRAELTSILDLEGLGKEIWAGVDPDEYVDQERKSWNR